MIFDIDFNKLIKKVSPPRLRRTRYIMFLRAVLEPLKTLYAFFMSFLEEKRYELSITGQTMILESHLNDVFDNILRRIKIQHFQVDSDYDYFVSEGQNPDFDYFESEGASARYIYFYGENTSGIATDFVVIIPAELAAKESQISATVKKHKIAGPEFAVTQT